MCQGCEEFIAKALDDAEKALEEKDPAEARLFVESVYVLLAYEMVPEDFAAEMDARARRVEKELEREGY